MAKGTVEAHKGILWRYLAGIGLGFVIAEMVARRTDSTMPWHTAFLGGSALVVIGSGLARAGQRSKTNENSTANKEGDLGSP
jgi:hypothetical protein